MIAFEILRNGKRLYTIGAGDLGLIHATVQWMRLDTDGLTHEHLALTGVATSGPDGTPSLWPVEELRVGDEITVRIIEADGYDPPPESGPQSRQFPPWQPHQSRF